jgi:hypothetical protein
LPQASFIIYRREFIILCVLKFRFGLWQVIDGLAL